jgi:hypothetical protein
MDGSSPRLPAGIPASEIGTFSWKSAERRPRHFRPEAQKRRLRLTGVFRTKPSALLEALPTRHTVASLKEKLAARAMPVAQAVAPAAIAQLRRLFPSLPVATDADEEHDPVRLVMADFDNLSSDQQDKVARNLVLLWNSFMSVFGGVSGFRSASPTEQRVYLEKLQSAARRMEAARGTEAAFHYVTVELIRLYIGFLQVGSTDPSAVALAKVVAPQIDRGHRMSAAPFISPIPSASTGA